MAASKKILIAIAVTVALLATTAVILALLDTSLLRVSFIDSQGTTRHLRVEQALTPSQRAIGLMWRTDLGRADGMLFDFGEDKPVLMWMKNTYIALDMVFIGADGDVKCIAAARPPLSEEIVSCPTDVRYVLELPAGRAQAEQLCIGCKVLPTAPR
jgi:uncharacterized membrane protein (UPF0127 family)